MKQSFHSHAVDPQQVETVARRLFSACDTRVERVLSGISTYVYRIATQGQVYYLRILPDEGASLTPEVAVINLLRRYQVRVPEIIHFERCNELLGRPIMVETEIRGQALSRSSYPREVLARVAREAGRDLARLNQVPVEGFGWVKAHYERPTRLYAKWPTYRAFALEFREADLFYLKTRIIKPRESKRLERVLARYDAWLDIRQGYLAHGDFDSTHIFQERGRYTGIIDFGEARGGSLWYDLAHFRIRDGARPPYSLFEALECGYEEITPLPPIYEQRLRFTSILINIRALSRAFHTRQPDQYIWRQLDMLREDVAALD